MHCISKQILYPSPDPMWRPIGTLAPSSSAQTSEPLSPQSANGSPADSHSTVPRKTLRSASRVTCVTFLLGFKASGITGSWSSASALRWSSTKRPLVIPVAAPCFRTGSPPSSRSSSLRCSNDNVWGDSLFRSVTPNNDRASFPSRRATTLKSTNGSSPLTQV